jgi:ribosomal protein S18 acetylase RimI-like enzyme
MNPHISLREATAADLPAICLLGEEVNALHHHAEPQVFAPPGDPERHRAHWQATLGQPAATTFVALDGDAVVGFITVTVVDETHSLLQPLRFARIGTVGVCAQQRGAGIGKALMVRAEAWAHARGCVETRLQVGAFNTRAARLYAELGYELRTSMLARALV